MKEKKAKVSKKWEEKYLAATGKKEQENTEKNPIKEGDYKTTGIKRRKESNLTYSSEFGTSIRRLEEIQCRISITVYPSFPESKQSNKQIMEYK